jgi:hypothetical protein
MADPSVFDVLRIPPEVLIAFDNRTFHFAIQPWHYLIRIAHIVSMGAFFGGIVFLDLRLMGLKSRVAIHNLSEQFMLWIYMFFGLTVLTGIPLFLYDPVHVGSHAYFTPKLILLVLGLANAALFNRLVGAKLAPDDGITPWQARVAGTLSVLLWTGVVVCSSMNVEGIPKVLLR